MSDVDAAITIASGRAWSFLVAGEERQFQGNAGYEDVAEESYSYDSTVGNHLRVAVSDLVVVRNSFEALGVAYVEKLDVTPDQEKLRRRCPSCRSTGFKERVTEAPRFRCSPCGSVFPDPTVEVIPVSTYRAHYGGTWQPLEGCLNKAQLAELSLSKSDQQSIKALDRERTLAAVAARGIRLPGKGHAPRTGRRHPLELPGGRRRTTIAARRGQDAFRRALVARYGMICAATGPAPAEVLEAAHIRPFAKTERHRVEEGLLLRADIHRLFDSGLLAISRDLRLHTAPSLRGHLKYSELEGAPLHIPMDCVLDLDVVDEHHSTVTATW